MIWLWLYRLWRAITALLVLPPAGLPRIDVNAVCPACGAKEGALRAIRPPHEEQPIVMNVCMVQHTCKVCGARWFQKTVRVDDQKGMLIWPSE